MLFCVLGLSACHGEEVVEANAPSWRLDEDIPAIAPRDMSRDLGEEVSQGEMGTPSREDLGNSGRVDMGDGHEDMRLLDMNARLDSGQDEEMGALARMCVASTLPRVTVPSVLSDSLVRGRGTINDTRCSTIADGQEKHYLLQIDREMVVDLWTTYQNGETDDFTPILTLHEGCTFEEETIIACGGGIRSHQDNRNATIRRRLQPGAYLLTVDERVGGGFTYGEGGDFVLHVEETELAPNGTCETAEFLDIGQPSGHFIHLDDPRGDTGSERSCFTGTNMLYYEIEVPANSSVVARAKYAAIARKPVLRLDSSCARDASSLCEQRKWVHGSGRVDLANSADQPQRYILAVDDQERVPFLLTFETSPIASNALCDNAIALTSQVPGPEQSWLEAGELGPLCHTTEQMRSLFYTIDVPDQHRLFTYALSNSGSTRIVHREGCADLSTQCIDDEPINRSGMTKEVIVQAHYNDDYEPGSVQVVSHVVPLATHAQCTQALPLEPGVTLENQDIRQGAEPFNACQVVMVDRQPTLYYALDLPLGSSHTYRIRATANDPSDLSLSLQVVQDADDPSECFTGGCYTKDDAYFRGGPEAMVNVDEVIGGGRDPARAIIAVSMSPGLDPNRGLFSITAEPLPR